MKLEFNCSFYGSLCIIYRLTYYIHILKSAHFFIKAIGHLPALLFQVFEAKPSSSLGIQFQTVKPQGVVMYTSHLSGDKYLSMELYDGNLYLVSKFGKQSQRTLLLKNANDRNSHKVRGGNDLTCCGSC